MRIKKQTSHYYSGTSNPLARDSVQALSILAREKLVLEVGVFPEDKYPDGKLVATVAASHEFGSNKVPARPFMRNTVSFKSNEWAHKLAYLSESVDIKHPVPAPEDIKKGLLSFGKDVGTDLQNTIKESVPPPLADGTLRSRKVKKDSDIPLIDTEQLIDSIHARLNDE